MLGVRVAELEESNAMRRAWILGVFFGGAEGGSKEPTQGGVLCCYCSADEYVPRVCTMRCDALNSAATWNGNGRKFYSLLSRVSLKLPKSCSPSSICTLRQREIRDNRQQTRSRDMLLFSQPVPRPTIQPSIHPFIHRSSATEFNKFRFHLAFFILARVPRS